MKIVQILPEFHEGGVERHVLWLSNELVSMGHEVLVVSGGGKLEDQLDERVETFTLPVYQKNPFTGAWSAFRLASKVNREGWQILHAHSRVPAWIAWWTSGLCGKPWLFTAHALYSLNAGISPFRKAKGAICVSETVRGHLDCYLPRRISVIANGLPPAEQRWKGLAFPGNSRFLFVGRLTRLKALDVILEALGCLKNYSWNLDVVGDGPQRLELEAQVRVLGLDGRVVFRGFRDDVEDWMAEAGCLLFPSLEEGMGLVAMQAIQMGLPVLSSDLEPLRPYAEDLTSLIPPGDVEAWRAGIEKILKGMSGSLFQDGKLPTTTSMARTVGQFYESILN